MWNLVSKILYRLLSLIVAIPIGRAVSKLIKHAWAAAKPGDPPRNPKKADTGWGDALTWAVISGVGTAIAQLLSTKGAAGAWKAIFGTPPPGYEEDPKKAELV